MTKYYCWEMIQKRNINNYFSFQVYEDTLKKLNLDPETTILAQGKI